jgi:hypothetical protein
MSNSSGFPWFQFRKSALVPFVFNEAGRGLTISIFNRPSLTRVRVYLAGLVFCW